MTLGHFGQSGYYQSNVKFGGFWSQLEESNVSTHTELCHIETTCLRMKLQVV